MKLDKFRNILLLSALIFSMIQIIPIFSNNTNNISQNKNNTDDQPVKYYFKAPLPSIKKEDNRGLAPGIYNNYRYSCIALDSSNNIYITTDNYSSIIVFKKNESTFLDIWSKDWKRGSKSYVYDCAVDSTDNLYVVGASYNGLDWDILLVKFNGTNGHEIWNKTYDRSSMNDEAYSIAVNQTNGDIFVLGYSDVSLSETNITLICYSSTGIQKWVKCWAPNNNADNMGRGMDLDVNGNIYITGYSKISDNKHLYIGKLSCSDGSTLWSHVENSIYADGYDISVNSSGDIYVYGRTSWYSSSGKYQAILVKYNSNGVAQWNKIYDLNVIQGKSENDNYACDIAFDSKGYLIAAGYYRANITNTQDIFLMVFSSTGKVLTYITENVISYDEYYCDIDIGNNDKIYLVAIESITPYDQISFYKYNRAPSPFNLTTDAENPEIDGSFNLNWTKSVDADNYTLYKDDQPITAVTGDLEVVINETTNLSYHYEENQEGTWYFAVLAKNSLGSILSNYIAVNVSLKVEINGDDEFTVKNGISGGSGTQFDPYIIENWDLHRNNSGACIILRNTR
ncbi:MAG: hypothetical protein ACTSQS_17060, partial [Promethearchaeota archaeon]